MTSTSTPSWSCRRSRRRRVTRAARKTKGPAAILVDADDRLGDDARAARQPRAERGRASRLLVRMHAAALNGASSCSAMACTANPAPGRRSAAKGGRSRRRRRRRRRLSSRRSRHGSMRGGVLGLRADGGGRSDDRARRTVVGTSGEHSADFPRRLRHARAAGAAESRRVAARQRRLVGRRRGVAAAWQGARRARHRHVGSADKLAALAPLGLDVALSTRRPDFAPAVMAATAQHGADLVVNTVGGSVFAESLRALAFEGAWRRWATSTAWSTPRSTSRPCMPGA